MIGKFLASACTVALCASAALATPVQFKMTGIVYAGNDALGIFGPAGAGLIGQRFTATYLFDPALQTASVDNATEFDSYSNEFKSGPSIGLGASVTINGHTVHVSGNYASEIHVKETADFSELLIQQYDYDADTGIQTVMETWISDDFDIGYGSPTLGPWSGSILPMNSFASWRIEDEYGAYDWVTMDTRHITISAPAPAPEPASWALMLGGFGLVGGALRTRRRIAFA